MDSRTKFVELISAAAAVYNVKPLSVQGVEMYWRLLERFEIEQVQAAMTRHMETSEFFPKPAELIRTIEGTIEDQALAAWLSVLQAIRKVGSGSKPEFHDAAIWPAIDALGGWIKTCQHPENERHFWQKRFSDAYAMETRRTRYKALELIPGLKAIGNG